MKLQDYLKIAGVKPQVNIEEEIIKFFSKGDTVTESSIEVLVDGLGIDSKAFYESMYILLSKLVEMKDRKCKKCGEKYDKDGKCPSCGDSYMKEDEDDDMDDDDMDDDDMDMEASEMTIGKHNDMKDDEFDAEQLAMGIEVEMEHTDDPEVSKAIAKDHLAELPDYYTRLANMERDGGAEDSEMDDDDDHEGEDLNAGE